MAHLPFNLPANIPHTLHYDPHPFYNPETFPNNMYSHLHPRQLNNPIDMQTLGMISALAPHLRQLDVQGKYQEDLAHAPAKGVHKDKNLDFQIYLDVGLFAPEEITVKIIKDHVVIEAKHEERQAHDIGFVSRHFMRRYELPTGYNPDAIVSKLSSDGILSVLLPKPTFKPTERIVTIQQAGPNIFYKKHQSIQNDYVKTDQDTCEKDTTKNGLEEVDEK